LKAFLVEKRGYAFDDVRIVEFTQAPPPEDMVAQILAGEPDIVGLSCDFWNVKKLTAAARRIKELRPRTRIVLGGPEVGPISTSVLHAHPDIDVIVKSEGEIVFAEIGDAWREGGDVAGGRGSRFATAPTPSSKMTAPDPAGPQSHPFAPSLPLRGPHRPDRLPRDAARMRVPLQLLLLQQGPRASFKHALNFASSLQPHDLAVFPLMILPGTELWRKAEVLGPRMSCAPTPP
jgi:radical SAM superfamily enzyme YgiQ (UPF0313 family)